VKQMIFGGDFFDRDSVTVAQDLVGKVLRRKWRGRWLAAAIVEAEAYSIREKGSHASLGRTPSREALFMRAGTIYMYYSRAGDSLNVTCREGDAVLVKSARPYIDAMSPEKNVHAMQQLNPLGDRERPRPRLCSGQTLLCRSLALTVREWNARDFDPEKFYLEDVGYRPEQWIRARRLGIPIGCDEHLMYRFIDAAHLESATENPLSKRTAKAGADYELIHIRR